MDTIFTLHGIDLNKAFDQTVKWLLSSGFHILLTLIIAWAGLRFGQLFVHRTLNLALRDSGKDPLASIQTGKRRKTLESLLFTVLHFTVFILVSLMIFQEIGLAVGPILASAGIAGVAIGFGAQSLVKDVITGAFIVLEQQFSIGDVVKIADRSGVVEYMGLRSTTLRDGEGTAHIIPNGKIEMVSVMTKGWSQLVLDLDVTYDTDVDHAVTTIQKVLKGYAQEFSAEVIGEPQVLGIEAIGDNSIKIRSQLKTIPGKHWDAGRIIRRQIKEAFTREGIKIPSQQSAAWIRG
jgi:moderate conductance mechanosensitive channel